MKWSDRTTYQGKRVNQGTLAIFKAANTILQNSPHYGKEKSNMTLVQGGYNKGGVAASAGTHDGGGAFDITSHNYKNRVKVLRLLGTATWFRPTLRGHWSAHIHGIVCGDGTASRGAKGQVTSYYNGRNGLANNAKDPDWRPKTLPILFVAPWDSRGKPGVYYFAKNGTYYDQPNTKGTKRGSSKKGGKFTVVAVVNVKGTLWAINTHGNCTLKSNLTTKKPADPKPVNPIKTEPFDAWWRVTKNGKWGLDGPNGKNKYERAAGYKLHTVEKAVIDGKPWYVTAHGTWYDAQHLVTWVDQEQPEPAPEPEPTPEVPELVPVEDSRIYTVKADPFLWALESPGSGNVKKDKRTNGSKFKAKSRVDLGNGDIWVQGVDGFWSSARYLSLSSVNLNIGTINVIRWRLGKTNPRGVGSFKKGMDYKDRVPGFAKMRKEMSVSMFSTTESGQYADADLLTKELGKEWSNVLHGDNAGDLTAAIHWHTPKRKMLDKGKYTTYGPHHNWATWVLFEDIKSGTVFLHVATHLTHEKRGTTSATDADKVRGKQAKALISEAKKIANDAAKKYKVNTVPIVFSGDFNQDDDDKFDIVGDEMDKAGFADAEKLALEKTGPDTTYPNLPGYSPSHRRFDRLFVPKGSHVGWMKTVVGPPYTDHNGVSINVTLSND